MPRHNSEHPGQARRFPSSTDRPRPPAQNKAPAGTARGRRSPALCGSRPRTPSSAVPSGWCQAENQCGQKAAFSGGRPCAIPQKIPA